MSVAIAHKFIKNSTDKTFPTLKEFCRVWYSGHVQPLIAAELVGAAGIYYAARNNYCNFLGGTCETPRTMTDEWAQATERMSAESRHTVQAYEGSAVHNSGKRFFAPMPQLSFGIKTPVDATLPSHH
eukprot:CAMPEP_0182855250 /NCGR_PEP_ID=MMETSP0034_2-20130328/1732_1 /TAXON_ID=156128 /ORGANISM="Nephroselmis pyriformis, Strain CCMP717" /LENGTH=126 /DNA_ID=CAMNT_0024986187 /DNA_START=102 /DNA_END=482 /DNA_ORIENTATION=-